MISTARVIVTRKCNRECLKCVNDQQQESIRILESDEELSGYDEIIITGGEPLLFPQKLHRFIENTHKLNRWKRVILYTTAPDYFALMRLRRHFVGITISLYTDEDVRRFNFWANILERDLEIHPSAHSFPIIRVREFFEEHTEKPAYDCSFVEFKMCKRKELCTLAPNETLFELGSPIEQRYQ
jgi:hypothetical protein